ncbi:MAG: 50S ribosomal protein L24 [Candidatus Sumerlaeaceae bacterium]|jgi:large subunit ribosomal protein L24
MSLRIKKNDRVVVITGKNRGLVSRVLYVIPKKNRAVVENVNMIKRHMRARGPNQPGGIVEREAPIHISNLMLYCEKCKKGVRFASRMTSDGAKQRVCKGCGSVL